MEPEPLMGVSMSQMRARLQPLGLEHPGGEAMALATAMGIFLQYDAIPDPDPPVFTAAPLASAVAAHVQPPRDGTDLISIFPAPELVFSRLPAKDAARTAVLSKRWRDFWLSAPLAVVDAHILPCSVPVPPVRAAPGGDDITSKTAVAVASRILEAHKGPFRCVHLTLCHMASHQAEMERWLELLAKKGVHELAFINRPWPLDLPLPATLFSWEKLTSLHLGLWRLPDTAKLRRNKGFPKLRKLVLSFVLMRDRDLSFLLEKSPNLEDLTIIGSLTKVNLRLDHPSLRCVQVSVAGLARIAVVDPWMLLA
ncbi:unnamed protein product [Urochloa humidicola]